jgi:hypothetical protein
MVKDGVFAMISAFRTSNSSSEENDIRGIQIGKE